MAITGGAHLTRSVSKRSIGPPLLFGIQFGRERSLYISASYYCTSYCFVHDVSAKNFRSVGIGLSMVLRIMHIISFYTKMPLNY